jgi:hypothetical protein
MIDAFALRPELGSVCRFLRRRPRARFVRPVPRTALRGVLADLADSRGYS